MTTMTGGFGSLPRSLKDKQRQAVLKLLNFNSDDAGKRTAANFDGVSEFGMVLPAFAKAVVYLVGNTACLAGPRCSYLVNPLP